MDILHNNSVGVPLHDGSGMGVRAIFNRGGCYSNAVKGQPALPPSARGYEVLHNNACNACGDYSNFLGIGSKVPFWAKVGLTIGGIFAVTWLIKSMTK